MKTIIIVLAVFAALALTCVGVGSLAAVFLGNQFAPPEGVVVDVQAPGTVEVGEAFQIIVTISNELDRPRTVYDLDIWEPLYQGVTITGVSPEPDSIDGTMGIYTASMGMTVPPLGQATITIDAVGAQQGVHTGDVDVGIDGIVKIVTTEVSIEVTPAN